MIVAMCTLYCQIAAHLSLRFVVTCLDQTCRLWYVQNATCLLQYSGHKGSVNSVRFHPSQDLVLTSSGDGTAHIWRATVTKPLLADSPVRLGVHVPTCMYGHVVCSDVDYSLLNSVSLELMSYDCYLCL